MPSDEPACWVCGSRRTRRWKTRGLDRPLTAHDLAVTDLHYGRILPLRRCPDCGFIFAQADDLDHVLQLYEGLTDDEYVTTEAPRAIQMRWLLQRLRRFHGIPRSVIDIGAGTGLLVGEAAALGMDSIGVEPSRYFVDIARSRGRAVVRGSLPHPVVSGRKFDLVTLVDVIEHVTEPVGLLRHCAELVSGGGLVVVVTPDVASIARRVLGERWWHFRLAHIGYFNRRSLREAGLAAGLTAVSDFRARWFFPVDYLATRLEQYLPVASLNRVARRLPLLRRLYASVVPVNPRDSIVMLFRRQPDRVAP